jgi:hypothetical protein
MPRSRRLITEVASGLAAQGIPCLRFDYLGTGDATGGGELVDFSSIQADMELAAQALRSLVQTDRIVILAWRAAALPLSAWLATGVRPAKVVLWEPIEDGSRWLAKLEVEDAAERNSRRPYGLRRTGTTAPHDDQLMGFAISARFRREIADATLSSPEWLNDMAVWALLRDDGRPVEAPWQRVFTLPQNAPEFGGAATVDATMFLSPGVGRIVDDLGRALLAEDRQ